MTDQNDTDGATVRLFVASLQDNMRFVMNVLKMRKFPVTHFRLAIPVSRTFTFTERNAIQQQMYTFAIDTKMTYQIDFVRQAEAWNTHPTGTEARTVGVEVTMPVQEEYGDDFNNSSTFTFTQL